MKSYSETNIFLEWELQALRLATQLVDLIELKAFSTDIMDLRCHEVARAVGRVLHLPFQDGKFGFVDHTWLWMSPLEDKLDLPSLLDVYVVGSLPQVRLVDMGSGALPYRSEYRWDKARDDIDGEVVTVLLRQMQRKAGKQLEEELRQWEKMPKERKKR